METNFNFKSQICTSIEQSRRLLELGLKKETADCYWWQENDQYGDGNGKWHLEALDTKESREHFEYLDKIFDDDLFIPAWSLWRLIEMLPPSIKDGYHYSLIYDIHRDAIAYMCFANGGLQRPYNRLLWDTQSIDPFDNIICCYDWLIKEGYFNKEYLE